MEYTVVCMTKYYLNCFTSNVKYSCYFITDSSSIMVLPWTSLIITFAYHGKMDMTNLAIDFISKLFSLVIMCGVCISYDIASLLVHKTHYHSNEKNVFVLICTKHCSNCAQNVK